MSSTETLTLARMLDTIAEQIDATFADGPDRAAIAEAAQRLRELHAMCCAAAAEIDQHWAAHCDEAGCGPLSLLARLRGQLPADYQPKSDTQ